MLYLNAALPVRPLGDGRPQDRHGVVLGRRTGSPPSDYTISLPRSFQGEKTLQPHLYHKLTISRVAGSQALRIVSSESQKLYLILTSRLSREPNFVGNIRVPRDQSVQILARTAPFFGAGQWSTLVIEARVGNAFYINWNHSDGSAARSGFYYVDRLDHVSACERDGIADTIAQLGVTPPFTVQQPSDPAASQLVLKEWRKL